MLTDQKDDCALSQASRPPASAMPLWQEYPEARSGHSPDSPVSGPERRAP